MTFLNSVSRGRRLQPERRSGLRILTLRNAFWAALAAIIVFAIFSLYIDSRSAGDSEYGRLYERRSDAAQKPAPPPPPRR
ncbi:MAG TPA: hypothetical protein VGF28_20625 [Thermoanaerobaculia bacterium]|jgi:hypothetical protein